MNHKQRSVTVKLDVTKRWVEYFNELLNGNDTVTSSDLPIFNSQDSGDAAHGTEAPPSYQEVTLAIRRLKNKKSPGSDTCGILKSRRRCTC